MTANSDKNALLNALRGTAIVSVCLLLAGCPSASNPTQPQSQPSAPSASTPPPPASGSSGSSGSQSSSGSAGSAGSSAPTAGSTPGAGGASGASSGAESTAGSGPTASDSSGSQGPAGGGQPTGGSSEGDIASRGAQGGGEGATGGSAQGQAGAGSGAGDSPAGGAQALPDMRDTPTMDDSVLAALEEAMGAAGEGSGENGGNEGSGAEAGSDDTGPATGKPPGGSGGTGTGPLTPAEQVAILDARLESGSGDFDRIILEEQARQRSARRSSTRPDAPEPEDDGGAAGSREQGPYGEEVATAGGYGSRGSGSVNTPGGAPPANSAKYPPPADIPSGNDDDVVARQLREAAMREPDPAVREKLWDEYRKYKGIEP